MSSDSTWVPDEDAQSLFTERCWLQGAIISAIAYGINIPLYYMSFYLFILDRNRTEFKSRRRLPLLIYLVVSFFLNTLFMIALAGFTQMAFIDNRNYPGGPSAFEDDMFRIPIDQVSNVAFIMSNWLNDALVVWRFQVIYQRCRLPMWVIMPFPCILFGGSIATGIMTITQDSITNATNTRNTFLLTYGVMTLWLNVILTIAIVLRLMHFRNNIVSVMGPHHGAHYISIASMIIESTTLFSTTCIVFLALFGTGNPVARVFIQSLNQIQTISTLLIVFRVAQGKGWDKGTATYIMEPRGSRSEPIELTSMQFSSQVDGSLTLASSGDSRKGNRAVEFQENLHVSNKLSKDVSYSG